MPERWDNEDLTKGQLLGFGFGLRACFGRKFATEEMKLFLFRILQKYQIVSVPGHPLQVLN